MDRAAACAEQPADSCGPQLWPRACLPAQTVAPSPTYASGSVDSKDPIMPPRILLSMPRDVSLTAVGGWRNSATPRLATATNDIPVSVRSWSPVDDNDLILIGGWWGAGVELGVDDSQLAVEEDGGRWKLEGVVFDDAFNRPGPQVAAQLDP